MTSGMSSISRYGAARPPSTITSSDASSIGSRSRANRIATTPVSSVRSWRSNRQPRLLESPPPCRLHLRVTEVTSEAGCSGQRTVPYAHAQPRWSVLGYGEAIVGTSRGGGGSGGVRFRQSGGDAPASQGRVGRSGSPAPPLPGRSRRRSRSGPDGHRTASAPSVRGRGDRPCR